MREIRQSGSEGGVGRKPYPYPYRCVIHCGDSVPLRNGAIAGAWLAGSMVLY